MPKWHLFLASCFSISIWTLVWNQGYKRAPRKRGMSVNRTFLSKGRANAPDNDKTLRIMIKMWYYLVSWRQCVGRVVGLELRACVQTTTAVSAAGSSRRTAPHGPACRPAAPSLCLYFVILSSSYYRISSVISCVCAPPSIRILLPSVAHQVLYPCNVCICLIVMIGKGIFRF